MQLAGDKESPVLNRGVDVSGKHCIAFFPCLPVSPWTMCEERWAIPKFHQRGKKPIQRSVLESFQSVVNENSAAAQPLVGIKRPTQSPS